RRVELGLRAAADLADLRGRLARRRRRSPVVRGGGVAVSRLSGLGICSSMAEKKSKAKKDPAKKGKAKRSAAAKKAAATRKETEAGKQVQRARLDRRRSAGETADALATAAKAVGSTTGKAAKAVAEKASAEIDKRR